MERAEFEPALDQYGDAVSGTYTDSIDWRKRGPQFGADTVIDVTFTVTAKGETVDCVVNEISGETSSEMRQNFEREPCPGTNRRSRKVYRDENGVPIDKRVNLKVLVETNDILE